jgi:hypothetical protein
MNPNPSQAAPPNPDPRQPYAPPGYTAASPAPPSRTPYILAGIGALFASGYWALVTCILGLGAAYGSVSGFQIAMPIVLIVLYALRGVQILKGDTKAARRVLWLHIVGGAVAVLNMASGSGVVIMLSGLKILVHIFGGITAYVAQRSPSPNENQIPMF